MSTKIHFFKMHGAGNDYIYVDATHYTIPDPSTAARLWSDRHFGIGSDGLVLIDQADNTIADFSMRIFNADGSEALMCGNASRCVGKLIYETGMTRLCRVRLATQSGVKLLDLDIDENDKVKSVSVDLLEPAFSDERLFLPQGEPLPPGVFVSTGNPNYVIFVDNLDAVDVAAEGARLERHSRFPERCNIEFAQLTSDGMRLRVWERGSGITMACGTGACAAVAATATLGKTPRRCDVIMDGGTLHVDWNETNNHLYLSGPATIVFQGEINLPEPPCT